jgi:biotin transport system substrate-specific component
MSQEHEAVDLVADETVKHVAFAAVLAALTAAFAYISIPLPGLPAPVSFQMLGVYLAGLLLGPRWGGFSVALYLLVGIAGAPVFSNGSAGLGYALGPTGGFLVGFLLAAVVIGAVVHRRLDPRPLADVSVLLQGAALAVGLAIIYAVGGAWLMVSTGYSLPAVLTLFGTTYLPGDLVKIVATVGLVQAGVFARRQADLAA